MTKLKVDIEIALGNDAVLNVDQVEEILQKAIAFPFTQETTKRGVQDTNGNTIGYIEFRYLEDE